MRDQKGEVELIVLGLLAALVVVLAMPAFGVFTTEPPPASAAAQTHTAQ